MATKKGIKRLSVILVVAMLLSLIPATLGFAAEVNTAKVEGFVTRLYNTAFDRDPDAEGLKYWTDILAKGERTVAQIIDYWMFVSPEFTKKNLSDEQFVEVAYKTFFDRTADAGGKAHWVGELANGGTRRYVVAAMMSAPTKEFQNICTAAGIKLGNLKITAADRPLTVTAVVSGAKTLKLTFNKAVAAADVDVKFGYLSVDGKFTFAADSKSADFVADYDLLAGNYTVEVGGKVFSTVAVAAQTVAKVEITTAWLQVGATNEVTYKAYNQYGEEFVVPASSFTATAWNITDGTPVTLTTSDNKFGVSTVLVKDKSILISLIHNATGKNAQATLTVNAESGVRGVQLSTVAPLTGKNRITAGENDLVLPVKLLDQFGKAIAIPSDLFTKATKDVIFISSNPLVVDVADFAVAVDDKGVNYVTFDVKAAGAATITAIVPATVAQSSVTVAVDSAAVLKSFTVQQPRGLAVVNESMQVVYAALDQYNGAITLANYNHSGAITWISNNPLVVNPAADMSVADGKLYVKPAAAGVVTLSAYYGATLQGSITLDVKAVAAVAKIKGLSADAIVRFGNGGVHTFTVADFTFLDQYNRTVTNDSVLKLVEGNLAVALKSGAATDIVSLPASSKTATGTAKAGETTFVATYEGKTFEFKVYALADSAIVNYNVTAVANTTLYNGGASYNKVIEVANGLDANGNKVAVAGAFDLVINSNPAAVTVDVDDMSSIVVSGTGANDSKSTVSFWKSGKKVGEYTFTVSTAAPVATKLAWADGVSNTVAKTATNDLKAKLVVTDQYGVNFTTTPAGVWMTTDATIAAVNSSTGVVTGVKAGKATVTYVASANGANLAIEITVTE